GEASWGAAYRVVIDLASDPPALHAHTAASQSGNPGSPYYADQLHDWLAMRYHEIVLKPRAAVEESGATWTIDPKS
ncbi:MAG: penicillin acylase family protein, partial [Planctomycetes bacterium]|nr:penicillin acylase family protein [Planctomycetota bacterium]